MLVRKRKDVRPEARRRHELHPRVERAAMLTIALILTVAIAVTTFWGGGYFWVPLAVLFFVVWGFYYVLTRAVARNPMHRHQAGLSDRFADGQPLGRSISHEELSVREREEEALEEEARLHDRYQGPREPPGVEGPPPHVPFP